ncbi:hypothetical protein BN14_07968 [Rhizoctonia solani AG-1 IB]|uniref:Uncharacterized protein n=1 Tax=Thanatephorus cucumeris (strain AG1-IB / isolate 7/3/14) TaxID=1108050 RepID=M5CDD9_THACB|nr:hypothetical protein BN14_07968 [Rhizoctonia solani AG-1 IB]
MSFRNSFKTTKAKLKKCLGVGEEIASSSTSAPSSCPSSVPPPRSTNATSSSSVPAQCNTAISNAGPPAAADIPSKSPGAWAGVGTLLTTLESSTGAFPPLAFAISSFIACIDIIERSFKEHKEYEQLAPRLENTLTDLSAHKLTNLPRESQMTKSVQRLDIKPETKSFKNIQDRASGRQLVDALAGLNDITECYRRINDHLKRLMLNSNLAILDAVSKQAMEAQLNKMLPSMSATYNSAAFSCI